MSADYEGGFPLKDAQSRTAGHVQIRTVCGLTFLQLEVGSGRGSSYVMIDLDPDQVAEFIGGLKLAHRAAREFENRAAGVR